MKWPLRFGRRLFVLVLAAPSQASERRGQVRVDVLRVGSTSASSLSCHWLMVVEMAPAAPALVPPHRPWRAWRRRGWRRVVRVLQREVEKREGSTMSAVILTIRERHLPGLFLLI